MKKSFKYHKLFNCKLIIQLSLKLIKLLNQLDKSQSKFQLFINKLLKFLQFNKKQLLFKNQLLKLNKSLFIKIKSFKKIISFQRLILKITFKLKLKLLTDMNKELFQYSIQFKRQFKYHIFFKKLSKRQLLCHKLFKSLNMSMKSLNNKHQVLLSALILKFNKLDINNFMDKLEFISKHYYQNLEK